MSGRALVALWKTHHQSCARVCGCLPVTRAHALALAYDETCLFSSSYVVEGEARSTEEMRERERLADPERLRRLHPKPKP